MLNKIPSRLIRWLIIVGFFFLLCLTVLRLIFHFNFSPAGEKNVLDAFWLGLRYDARVVSIFLFIIYFSGLLLFFKPFTSGGSKKILLIFTRLFGLTIIVVYTFDFAHFSYLGQRLNASILNYTDDAKISASMVWQSYPVVKILLAWLIGLICIFFITRYFYRICNEINGEHKKRNRVFSYVIMFFILAFAIFGRVGQFPLRWSDAYQLNDDYKASLALNPFQSFFSSLNYRNAGFDINQSKHYYPLMSTELGITKQDSASLNFHRNSTVSGDSGKVTLPNIVLVICESFSAYKSSMWGNPLNTTPYFNELCKQGIFFKNCFSPAYGTARGVWAIITGIPDVTDTKTASRNPNLVDQHTILNDLTGYSKYYFIGGSASWANIRGLLTDNIKDLHLYEQEDYKASILNVWGISDKDLFLEANNVLRKQTSPFFAIIQTADNHRPYTIPKKDKPYLSLRNYPKDSLEKYGFWSNEELNAYVYMDYTYKIFLQAAQQEKYFNNTIFVFVGDHGIRGNAGDMFPKVWTEQGLTNQHVPLLFYSPALLTPKVIERKISQIDILPGIAQLLGVPVDNTTLGRNVFSMTDSSITNDLTNHTFILNWDAGLIGLVGSQYYYEYNMKIKEGKLYSLVNNDPVKPLSVDSSLITGMKNLTFGYYETARYMLYHNKKNK